MFAIASSGLCGASYILGPVVPAVSVVCRLLLAVGAKVHSGFQSCLCAGVYFCDTTICGRFLASANCKNASVIAVDDSQTLGRWCQGTGNYQRLIPEYKQVVDGNDTVSQNEASSQAAFTSILTMICQVYRRPRDLRRLWELTCHQCRAEVVAVYLLAIIICWRFF
jgi:hypothetical protein